MLRSVPVKLLNLCIVATMISTAFPARSSPGASASAPLAAAIISIADARARALGTEVTIEGAVTSPPGAFKSSKSDDGFTLEDESGGIYVRVNGRRAGVNGGVRLRVTGKLADSNGQLVIAPVSYRQVEVLGRSRARAPQLVETGQVNETTESRLVTIEGRISRPLVDDAPYGFRLYVNDGSGEIMVFVSTSTRIKRRGLLPGKRLGVTGVGGQYKDHYEVEPRFPADIRLLR